MRTQGGPIVPSQALQLLQAIPRPQQYVKVSMRPSEMDALGEAGVTQYRAGNYKKAADIFFEVYKAVASAFITNGMSPDILKDLNPVVLKTLDPELLFFFGLSLYKDSVSAPSISTRRRNNIKNVIETALFLQPKRIFNFQPDDYSSIARVLNDDFKTPARDAKASEIKLEVKLAEAKQLEKEEKFEEALTLYNNLIYLFPVHSDLYYYRAHLEGFLKIATDKVIIFLRMWIWVLTSDFHANVDFECRNEEVMKDLQKSSPDPMSFYLRILFQCAMKLINDSSQDDNIYELSTKYQNLYKRNIEFKAALHKLSKVDQQQLIRMFIRKFDNQPNEFFQKKSEEIFALYHRNEFRKAREDLGVLAGGECYKNFDFCILTGLVQVKLGYLKEAKCMFTSAFARPVSRTHLTDEDKKIILEVLDDTYEEENIKQQPLSKAHCDKFWNKAIELANQDKCADAAKVCNMIFRSLSVEEKKQNYQNALLLADNFRKEKKHVQSQFWFRRAIQLMPLNYEPYMQMCQDITEEIIDTREDKISYAQAITGMANHYHSLWINAIAITIGFEALIQQLTEKQIQDPGNISAYLTLINHLIVARRYFNKSKEDCGPLYETYFNKYLELNAQLALIHKEVEKRFPVPLVYNSFALDASEISNKGFYQIKFQEPRLSKLPSPQPLAADKKSENESAVKVPQEKEKTTEAKNPVEKKNAIKKIKSTKRRANRSAAKNEAKQKTEEIKHKTEETKHKAEEIKFIPFSEFDQYAEKGITHYRQGEYKEAISILGTIASHSRANPNFKINPAVLFYLSLAIYKESLNDEKIPKEHAIKTLLQALTCPPVTVRFMPEDLIAIMRCMNSDFKTTIEEKKSSELKLDLALKQAKELEIKGEYEEAATLYDSLLYFFPTNADLYLYRGQIEIYLKILSNKSQMLINLWIWVMGIKENPQTKINNLIKELFLQLKKGSLDPKIFLLLTTYHMIAREIKLAHRGETDRYKTNLSKLSNNFNSLIEASPEFNDAVNQLSKMDILQLKRLCLIEKLYVTADTPFLQSKADSILEAYRQNKIQEARDELILLNGTSIHEVPDLFLIIGLVQVKLGFLVEAKESFIRGKGFFLQMLNNQQKIQTRLNDQEKAIVFSVLNEFFDMQSRVTLLEKTEKITIETTPENEKNKMPSFQWLKQLEKQFGCPNITSSQLEKDMENVRRCYRENKYEEVSSIIFTMIDQAEKFCVQTAAQPLSREKLMTAVFVTLGPEVLFLLGLSHYHQYLASPNPSLLKTAKEHIKNALFLQGQIISFSENDFRSMVRCLMHDGKTLAYQSVVGPDVLRSQFKKAKESERKDALSEAAKLYDRLIDQYPSFSDLYFHRGLLERYQSITSERADIWMRLWVWILMQERFPERQLKYKIEKLESDLIIEALPSPKIFYLLSGFYSVVPEFELMNELSEQQCKGRETRIAQEPSDEIRTRYKNKLAALAPHYKRLYKESAAFKQAVQDLSRPEQMRLAQYFQDHPNHLQYETLYYYRQPNKLQIAQENLLLVLPSIKTSSDLSFIAGLVQTKLGLLEEAKINFTRALKLPRPSICLSDEEKEIVFSVMNDTYQKNNQPLLPINNNDKHFFAFMKKATELADQYKFSEAEKAFHIAFRVIPNENKQVFYEELLTGAEKIIKEKKHQIGQFWLKQLMRLMPLNDAAYMRMSQALEENMRKIEDKITHDQSVIAQFKSAISQPDPRLFSQLNSDHKNQYKDIASEMVDFLSTKLDSIKSKEDSVRLRAEHYYDLWVSVIVMTKGFDQIIQNLMKQKEENPLCVRVYFDLVNYLLAAMFYLFKTKKTDPDTLLKRREYHDQYTLLRREIKNKFHLDSIQNSISQLPNEVNKGFFYLCPPGLPSHDFTFAEFPRPNPVMDAKTAQKKSEEEAANKIKIEQDNLAKIAAEKKEKSDAEAKSKADEKAKADAEAKSIADAEKSKKAAEKEKIRKQNKLIRRAEKLAAEKEAAAEEERKKSEKKKNTITRVINHLIDRTMKQIDENTRINELKVSEQKKQEEKRVEAERQKAEKKREAEILGPSIFRNILNESVKKAQAEELVLVVDAKKHPKLHYVGLQFVELQKKLNGVIAIVGGSTRDLIEGKETGVKCDIDVVTSADFSQLKKSELKHVTFYRDEAKESVKKAAEKSYSFLTMTVPQHEHKELHGSVIGIPQVCHSPDLKSGYDKERLQRPLTRDAVYGVFFFEEGQLKIRLHGSRGIEHIRHNIFELNIDDLSINPAQNEKNICEAFKKDPLWIVRLISYSTERNGNIDRYIPLLRKMSQEEKHLFSKSEDPEFPQKLCQKLKKMRLSPFFPEFYKQFESLGLLDRFPRDARQSFLKPESLQEIYQAIFCAVSQDKRLPQEYLKMVFGFIHPGVEVQEISIEDIFSDLITKSEFKNALFIYFMKNPMNILHCISFFVEKNIGMPDALAELIEKITQESKLEIFYNANPNRNQLIKYMSQLHASQYASEYQEIFNGAAFGLLPEFALTVLIHGSASKQLAKHVPANVSPIPNSLFSNLYRAPSLTHATLVNRIPDAKTTDTKHHVPKVT